MHTTTTDEVRSILAHNDHLHIILIDMTTKNKNLQKQQAIDTWIVIALWVSAIWFSLARGFITGILSGWYPQHYLPRQALIVSCICLAIISRQMKKRHASKDHLTTIVRVSLYRHVNLIIYAALQCLILATWRPFQHYPCIQITLFHLKHQKLSPLSHVCGGSVYSYVLWYR